LNITHFLSYSNANLNVIGYFIIYENFRSSKLRNILSMSFNKDAHSKTKVTQSIKP